MIEGETRIASRDLTTLTFYAFRYALGRQTYATRDIADYVKKYWHLFTQAEQRRIQNEIEDAVHDKKAGAAMDVRIWNEILALKRKEA